MPASGTRDFTNDIAFPIAPRAVPNAMLSGRCRPKTEAVVMFACQNDAIHTTCLECGHNRVGIEGGRIKDPGIFITLAPFFPGKRIYSEMEKAVGLQFVP